MWPYSQVRPRETLPTSSAETLRPENRDFNPVSDTAAADASADKSGPTINEILTAHGHECTASAIVPDDVDKIQEIVRTWSDQALADLIVSTGGTGFGVRDRTPEVSACV